MIKNTSALLCYLLSQALIDLEISHEEFKTIVNEKEKHEKIIL